jgi:hypothetical protein
MNDIYGAIDDPGVEETDPGVHGGSIKKMRRQSPAGRQQGKESIKG